MKILLAEDSLTTRRLLAGQLQKWGFEVLESEDGAAAWEQFLKHEISLVLTDWQMPNMDGLQLIRRIRSEKRTGYVYVILLTARADKADLVTAMDAGADDFLVKPADKEELRVRVREGQRIIQLEERLAEQNRELRETQAALVETEKLAGLGQLAAGMSHEINNPIAFVSNNVAVLQREIAALLDLIAAYESARGTIAEHQPELGRRLSVLEEEVDIDWLRAYLPELMNSTQNGLKRVRDIVQNLRDFARLDEAAFDNIDLRAAVDMTVEVLSLTLATAQVEIRKDFEDVPLVSCRPARIHQVIHGVLMNAVQASRPGDVITVRTRTDRGFVVVEVSDQGSGIDESVQAHIFEPFYTTRSVGEGRGLGLAISYGILRDHGGHIEFESEAGIGTTFRIRLPLHQVSRDPDDGNA
ncbi:MAG: response regulator [Planctomycetaceae bacterium]